VQSHGLSYLLAPVILAGLFQDRLGLLAPFPADAFRARFGHVGLREIHRGAIFLLGPVASARFFWPALGVDTPSPLVGVEGCELADVGGSGCFGLVDSSTASRLTKTGLPLQLGGDCGDRVIRRGVGSLPVAAGGEIWANFLRNLPVLAIRRITASFEQPRHHLPHSVGDLVCWVCCSRFSQPMWWKAWWMKTRIMKPKPGAQGIRPTSFARLFCGHGRCRHELARV